MLFELMLANLFQLMPKSDLILVEINPSLFQIVKELIN